MPMNIPDASRALETLRKALFGGELKDEFRGIRTTGTARSQVYQPAAETRRKTTKPCLTYCWRLHRHKK